MFGPINPYGRYANSSWPGMGAYATPQFELSQDGRAVYEIIREAQARSQKNS
jgi:hypothetical protein